MKRKLILVPVLALIASALALAAIVPAVAQGNVGTVSHFPTTILDAAHHLRSAQCSYVHRTEMPGGGFQDKQECQFDAGATLPAQPVTFGNVSGWFWYSDYMWQSAHVVQFAKTWTVTIMPSGQVEVVSTY